MSTLLHMEWHQLVLHYIITHQEVLKFLMPTTQSFLTGAQETPKYVEPSQPPKGPESKLSDIPTVIGGKAVNKKSAMAATGKGPESKASREKSKPGSPSVEEGKTKSPVADSKTARPSSTGQMDSARSVPSDKSSGGGDQADEQGEAITAVRASPTVSLSVPHSLKQPWQKKALAPMLGRQFA